MINSDLVEKKFIQSAGSCVLSSYSVINNYFTETKISENFIAYCNHFNIEYLNEIDAEKKYEIHFDNEWKRRSCKGYEVIIDLHNTSEKELFNLARHSFESKFYLDTNYYIDEITKTLIVEEALLNVSYFSNPKYHSITIFYDNGFLIRDTIKPGLFKLDKITQLGNLFDSVLYKKRN